MINFNKIRLAVALCLLSLLFMLIASNGAQAKGNIYLSSGSGINLFAGNGHGDTLAVISARSKHNTVALGYTINGAFGFYLSDYVKMEVALSVFGHQEGRNTATNTKRTWFNVTSQLNAYILPLGASKFEPFIGVGVGSHVMGVIFNKNNTTPRKIYYDSFFGWNVSAGMHYYINDFIAIGGLYRFNQAVNAVLKNKGEEFDIKNQQNHSVAASVIFAF